MGDLLDLAVANEIIAKSGTWFSYQENRIGQGRENSKRFLGENPDITNDIENLLRLKLGLVGSEKATPNKSDKSKKVDKNG